MVDPLIGRQTDALLMIDPFGSGGLWFARFGSGIGSVKHAQSKTDTLGETGGAEGFSPT